MIKKSDMVKAIAQKASITQVQAEVIFDAFMDELCANLAKGEKVQFMGIGSFEVKERAARTGINPQTGKKIEIAASKNPVFKAGKALKDAIK